MNKALFGLVIAVTLGAMSSIAPAQEITGFYGGSFDLHPYYFSNQRFATFVPFPRYEYGWSWHITRQDIYGPSAPTPVIIYQRTYGGGVGAGMTSHRSGASSGPLIIDVKPSTKSDLLVSANASGQ